MKSHKHRKESTITSCCESINSNLHKDVVTDVIVEVEADRMPHEQMLNKLFIEYVEAQCNKAVQCAKVYDR